MLSCIAPLIILLNTDASVIVTLQQYKLPDPHVDMAGEWCQRNTGTCPVSVSIKPNGSLFIICKRKPNDNKND
jgi:hypothetical protein